MKKFTKIARWFLIAMLGVSFILLIVLIYIAKDLPSPTSLNQQQLSQSTKIYDRTGTVLLFNLHGEERRTNIALKDVPQNLISTTIAAEDNNFYKHWGVDLKAILRAAIANLKEGGISQGGSTITQQLVKSSILTSERTFTRKIKEAILALELEFKYSKNEILEMYLNQIPYGSNAYGVEAAAETYFGKSVKDLTLAESAIISALQRAPSFYSPFGPNKKELFNRQKIVLERAKELGLISDEQLKQALEEKMTFSKQKAPIKAPHFVFYVQEYLNEKYGEEFVNKAGWKVITTLDWDLQENAERIVNEGAKKNQKLWRASNAALVAIDPKTGQVVAMVGSYDYFDEKNDGNVNVTLRERSPGSSFKPFAYAAAFQKGYTDKTIVFDVPTEFNTACSPDGIPPEGQVYSENFCYHPGNYDKKFRGPVALREALAQSLNIPAVQVLYLAGTEETIRVAEKMGITSLKNRNRFGLSLVLGGAEVKPLEMARGYGVFAQEGVLHRTANVIEITDNNGKVIEKFEDNAKRVLDQNIAQMISDVLSDNNARAPVFGVTNSLSLEDRPVAAKTGTSQDYRDAWVVGYTPSISVAVWTGNNNNTPMSEGGAGIAAAGPIWNEFMRYASKKLPIETFTKPVWPQTEKPILNNIPYVIDPATQNKTYHSILFYVNKDDPNGPSPENPHTDPQFLNWEAAVQKWYGNQNNLNIQVDKTTNVLFTNPTANSQVTSDFLPISVSVSGAYTITQVDFFLDENLIGTSLFAPYQLFYKIPPSFDNGGHKLKARVYDQNQNSTQTIIDITLNRIR